MLLRSRFFPSRRRLAGQPLVFGIVCCWSLLSPRSGLFFCQADEKDFKSLIKTMENDVRALARAVEDRYAVRCQPELGVLRDCQETNYHELLSLMPGTECQVDSGGLLQLSECGNRSCGALWDYTHSSVRVPFGLVDDRTFYHPKDPAAVEMICFSSFMDQYLSARRSEAGGSPSWAQALFGSVTGAFRIYPGRTSPPYKDDSPGYDPRRRPWYVAASSGPKNVILIIDANSVNDGDKEIQRQMKAFANRTFVSLTSADGVAVVVVTPPASNFTATIGEYITNEKNYLYKGVNEKKKLTNEIDGLWRSTTTTTKTTTYDAFQKAFTILDNDGDKCSSTAILFLTAGGGSNATTNDTDDPTQKSEKDVLALVKEELAGRSKTILFTYSVGKAPDDESLENFPKQLACETKGVWSRIDDESNSNHENERPYNELFALGRSNAPIADIATWVDPYIFSTGRVEGTTVSAPVYDQTSGTLLGVVGMDIPMALLAGTLDGDEDRTRLELQDVVRESQQAQCSEALKWTDCQLELFWGSEANCPANCTTIAAAAGDGSNTTHGLQPCTGATTADFPTALWAGVNQTLLEMNYTQRVCCKKEGDTTPSDTCGVPSTATRAVAVADSGQWNALALGLTVGLALAALINVLLVVWIYVKVWRRTVPPSTIAPLPPPMSFHADSRVAVDADGAAAAEEPVSAVAEPVEAAQH